MKDKSMKNIDRLFVLTGLIFLLVGMALGLKMSASMDFSLHGLHAHLNLLGFVLMTLFGLCYRAWPKMQEGKLATVHYLLHTVSVGVALTMLYFLLTSPELGPKIGPPMNAFLGGAYLGILLFTYLVFTRTRD
jgi:cbb3-type cytochrome oxidase subunit 1